MSKMSRIALLHQEGYSAEYIATELKTDTITIKNIIYGVK